MDLPTDIWDIVFHQFTRKELDTIGFINKNATTSLLRIKWKRLNVSELSTAKPLASTFASGVFPYAHYVEELVICLHRNDTVDNLLWMQHFRNLKKITLRSSEDFYKDMKIDPEITAFLSQLFQNNPRLWNAVGGCRMLEVLKHKPTITSVTLCCEWTRHSFGVVSSFPNMRKLTLKKRVKAFEYFGIIPQVHELHIESSWMDPASLCKLSKVFPNIVKLSIDQEWGNQPFDLSYFQHLTDLEVYHLNVSRFPPHLTKLKSWSTKIEFLEMIPIYTLKELHMSLHVGHVFDFLDPSFEFLPSLFLTMMNLKYFSFAFEDGQSQLIISNALNRYGCPFVQMKDLNIMPIDGSLKFAILVDESIPVFIEYIGERMLAILKKSDIITQTGRIKYLKFVKSLFSSEDTDAKDEAVLRDIDEFYKRVARIAV